LKLTVHLNQLPKLSTSGALHVLPVHDFMAWTRKTTISCLLSVELRKVQSKGKVYPRRGHEGPVEEQSYSSTLSLNSALDSVGGQRHAPAALSPGKKPDIHCTGGWVGPRADLDWCTKSRLPPGFDLRTVQPVASRYTD
jgi:hypothetical protein